MHFLFFIVMVFNKPAYVYLDPGTDSILLQGLIAPVVGVMVTTRMYWTKIKSFFPGNKEKHEQQENEDKIDE